MRIGSLLIVAIVGVHSPVWAVCIAPGNPDCLPTDPLKLAFIETERNEPCHDVVRLDEEGRDLNPPDPSPTAKFARDHGEAAIPFYEAVIARCPDRYGWAGHAFSALADLGTPRAVELLARHAEPGQPNREEALSRLMRVLPPEALTERLLREIDPEMRRLFAISLWERGDARALPGLREALQRESDPQASQMLRTAVLQVEHPDRCVLIENHWGWDTLGNACGYLCRGIDFPISRKAWRVLLPCAPTVSRGWHLQPPRATRAWWIPILLLLGADALLRRGLAQGLVRKRTRVWRSTATGTEAVYIGLAWCAVSLIPLGAAYVIWAMTHH